MLSLRQGIEFEYQWMALVSAPPVATYLALQIQEVNR